MSKTNFFVKYLKNISNLINNLLEKNLNKLNSKNISFLFKNNKIILTFVALFVIFISYLLLPTFYKHNDISRKLENVLKSKFDLNFKFSDNIQYNLFPRPHFSAVNTKILSDQNEISKISKLKIFISYENLHSLKKIEVKDLILENSNFNLNKKNYNFFLELLNKNYQDGKLIIKNSNIFFNHIEDDVLFIIKIFKMKYNYDSKEKKNIFYSENEIFNIPFSIETFFNKNKSKILSKINFNLMRLKIENELFFDDDKRIGNSELILNKSKRIVDYRIEKNSFNFHFFDKIDQPNITYKGKFNFKPFYASLEGDLNFIDLDYLLSSNAIILQLLKTELLNNKNIDFSLKINANHVYNYLDFMNIIFNSKIKEGLIDADKTKFQWRDFAEFELNESLIFVKDGELVLDGKLKINIINYDRIYKYFVTPKKYRSKLDEIDLNIIYNFDQKIAELKDIRINNKISEKVNIILNSVILKKDKLQNKIYFKNLLNEAIKSYSG